MPKNRRRFDPWERRAERNLGLHPEKKAEPFRVVGYRDVVVDGKVYRAAVIESQYEHARRSEEACSVLVEA